MSCTSIRNKDIKSILKDGQKIQVEIISPDIIIGVNNFDKWNLFLEGITPNGYSLFSSNFGPFLCGNKHEKSQNFSSFLTKTSELMGKKCKDNQVELSSFGTGTLNTNQKGSIDDKNNIYKYYTSNQGTNNLLKETSVKVIPPKEKVRTHVLSLSYTYPMCTAKTHVCHVIKSMQLKSTSIKVNQAQLVSIQVHSLSYIHPTMIYSINHSSKPVISTSVKTVKTETRLSTSLSSLTYTISRMDCSATINNSIESNFQKGHATRKFHMQTECKDYYNILTDNVLTGYQLEPFVLINRKFCFTKTLVNQTVEPLFPTTLTSSIMNTCSFNRKIRIKKRYAKPYRSLQKIRHARIKSNKKGKGKNANNNNRRMRRITNQQNIKFLLFLTHLLNHILLHNARYIASNQLSTLKIFRSNEILFQLITRHF